MTKNSKDRRSLVLVSGYYGFDNLGDEAILEELTDELKRLVQPSEITVLSNNAERTSAAYGVASVARFDLATFARLLPSTRLFVSGGGGLFQDTTSLKSVAYYAGQIFLASLARTPVLIYAQGVGPLKSPIAQLLAREAFRRAKVVTVRDRDSFELLKGWGVKAQLTADPVWALQAKSTNAAIKAQVAKLKETHKLVLGLSLRQSHNFGPQQKELLINSLKTVLPENSYVLCLPLQEAQDSSLLQEISGRLNHFGIASGFLGQSSFDQASDWLTLVEQLDGMIAMRLHALIFSLKRNKPVVGLAYDPKVEYLMRAFDQPLVMLGSNSDNQSQDIWTKAITLMLQQIENFSPKSIEQRQLMEKMSCQNLAIIAKILGADS